MNRNLAYTTNVVSIILGEVKITWNGAKLRRKLRIKGLSYVNVIRG